MPAPLSKTARAVALKHLDLYKKWKQAITPAANSDGSLDACNIPSERPPVNGAGTIADVDGQAELPTDGHDVLERLTKDFTAEAEGKEVGSSKHTIARSPTDPSRGVRPPSSTQSATGTPLSQIEKLHAVCMSTLLPSLASSLSLNEEGIARAERFLEDRATLFRFYRRARYNIDSALELLHATLTWRLSTELDLMSLSTLHPLYVHGREGMGTSGAANIEDRKEGEAGSSEGTPLFWLSDRLVDRFGRPCGVISLRSLERVSPGEDLYPDHGDGDSKQQNSEGGGEGNAKAGKRTGGLNEVKEYIVACMEITRKYLGDAYSRRIKEHGGIDALLASIPTSLSPTGDLGEDEQLEEALSHCPPLQMTIAFDLASSGMANLELELLPFLLDILKNHFPGMVGVVYVLHFSWLHSGMWAVAKRILPQQALARIFFPNDKELCEDHFEPSSLPLSLGGQWQVKIDSKNNETMRRFGKRRAFTSRTRSRTQSAATTPAESPAVGGRLPLPSINVNDAGAGEHAKPTLSRNSSFESIYDVFYSADITPWASRYGTPRHSQPSTPGLENGPYSLGLGSAGWRMTPSAARKLRSLQMSRGDSGSVSNTRRGGHVSAEFAGGRQRATSDPRAQERERLQKPPAAFNARLGDNSTSMSPQGSLTQLQPQAGPAGYFGDDAYMQPSSRGRSRADSLDSLPDEGIAAHKAGRNRALSPQRRRIGGLRRDFQLRVPTKEEDAAQRDRLLSNANSDDEAASVTESQAGEGCGSDATITGDEGFFARWQRRSSLLLVAQRASNASAQDGADAIKWTGQQEKERRELERYRRNLQLAQQQQHQSQHLISSSATQQPDERGQFSGALGMSMDISVDADDPDAGSPQRQTRDIDEPPLAGERPYHPPRFVSVNRSRKYNKPGQVSPYNAENPFFGYPAYIAPLVPDGRPALQSDLGNRFSLSSQTPRHMHARRRKRDLVRTLSYLFFLRILAAHRSVRWRFKLLWRQIDLLLYGGHSRHAGQYEYECDVLWSADARRRSAVAQQHQLHRQQRRPPRPMLLRKRMLVIVVLLACLHAGWRAKLLELLFRPFWQSAQNQAITQRSAGRNSQQHLDRSRRLETTYTGLHVRKRLGFTN
ncbi:hypothetical protein K437DRAFT_257048 [Tilletiaria anomala UBC 951]|uniref:CRAL-TRIO domain-containing protein n=1 Tax=Tilletiaria anomala (strain ATCC 24038 / CBS 436.72 / UBC 951) TaxID=1037660 RepID=A0A066VST1_TILAU|nr:uncharacterized protein K437DRAFT_257048 [Tilletiaria anomala UBC 951]KDN44526.1 hypothetical protein K437DRAFT_257048 [Tilletiaria anomala UBC 951]